MMKGKIIFNTKVKVSKIKQIIINRTKLPSPIKDFKNNINYKSKYNVPILLYG